MNATEAREILSTTDNLTVGAEVCAPAVGVSTWAWYESIKRGDCPLPVIKIGRLYKHRTSDARALLGIAG